MAMGALMLPSAEDDMFALQRANRVGNHAGKYVNSHSLGCVRGLLFCVWLCA